VPWFSFDDMDSLDSDIFVSTWNSVRLKSLSCTGFKQDEVKTQFGN
jgi:hypothetical protein